MGYQQARGIIPWQEGDELPEETIARIRGRGEPEMMKLLNWLRRRQEIRYWDKAHLAFRDVEDYIEREFGYKLPEEGDSGQENDSPAQA